jgi:hypothetical protein
MWMDHNRRMQTAVVQINPIATGLMGYIVFDFSVFLFVVFCLAPPYSFDDTVGVRLTMKDFFF